MEHNGTKRGGVILAAGAAVQLLTGLPAAWGVFQRPVMEEYALSEAAAGLAFSILIAAYGVGCVLGGLRQDRYGPRRPALCGTALLCAGYLLAVYLPAGSAWLFYAGFSIPAGLGSAFLVPAVLSCAQKWYRGRKGFAAGVIGGAVGLSGACLSLLVGLMMRGLGRLQGIRAAFGLLCALTLPVCIAGSLALRDPPQSGGEGPKKNSGSRDFSPREMLRTKQYWLCAAAVCLSTPAVLLFSPILGRLGESRGLGAQAAAWSVVCGSAGSAAGRLLMPMLSDRTGRKQTQLLLFFLSGVLSAGFGFARGWWFAANYAGLTFCYSGLMAVQPALVTDLFGLRHAGVNYGFLALGQSAGSLLFPPLAQLLGWETERHWLAAAAAAAGFCAVWFALPGKTGRGVGEKG